MGRVSYDNFGSCGSGTGIVTGINLNSFGFKTNADLLLSKNSL